ncbi:carbohydrate kinase family protein [Segeticoccus rhizosphaerae]|jgi:sugar/nucleoside kinase (ribokinase family)|uniref:carbohydrate kinase family protein n=1 Tax=Segeticoccus rhizosphaerae TaxID=1104777 RepID=UPI0010C0D09B|nr:MULTISPECIES: carbohydrate kinase family protein [Intrasporangiaceae]
MSRVLIVGNANADVLVNGVTELPPPSTDTHVEEITVRAAGPVLNTAFILCALGDTAPDLLSTIGDDSLGQLVRDECQQHHLPADGLISIPDCRTGVSVAIEGPERPRAFLTDLGALARFEPDHLPRSLTGVGDLLSCGYFCTPQLRGEPTRRLLSRAVAAGVRTWLDCGWDLESWAGAGRDEILALLPQADVFVPNIEEAEALTGKSDPVEAGTVLAALTRHGVVIKAGEHGAFWVGGDGHVTHAPAPEVPLADTTGAGDALNAGMIYGLRHGLSIDEALRLGVQVASTVVARSSAERWDPLPEFGVEPARGRGTPIRAT